MILAIFLAVLRQAAYLYLKIENEFPQFMYLF